MPDDLNELHDGFAKIMREMHNLLISGSVRSMAFAASTEAGMMIHCYRADGVDSASLLVSALSDAITRIYDDIPEIPPGAAGEADSEEFDIPNDATAH